MRLGTALGWLGLPALIVAGLVFAPRAERVHSFAVCDEDPGDGSDLITITEPIPTDTGFGGPAPLKLNIHIASGLLIYAADGLVAEFRWGDGTSSAITELPCPDSEEAYWPEQDISHVYSVPGVYQMTWYVQSEGFVYDIPFLTLAVTDKPVATPAPNTPSTPPPAVVTPGTAVPSPSLSPSASPEPTVTATLTRTGTATTTPTPTEAGAPAPGETPPPTDPAVDGEVTVVPNEEYRPEIFLSIDPPTEISTDPGVVATNLVIAGVTVWVLFSSVLLNQVLQENRAAIDAGTARATGRLRRARERVRPPGPRAMPRWVRGAVGPVATLFLTGAIYSAVEPGFGWNAQTAVLFGSAMIGVGVVTYATSSLELLSLRRLTGARAAIRPYPAAIAIAAASVAVSRLLDLQPGIMFGFVASCVLASRIEAGPRESGRVALAPVTTALSMAIAAWLLVGPVRELNEDGSGWFPALLEASVMVVFIGGIEGVVITMLPLAETDGGKIYRWNRWLWATIALAAAFMTWHVLFGRERTAFTGLRAAESVTVLIVFVVTTALTVGLWAYFRLKEREADVDVAPDPSPAA